MLAAKPNLRAHLTRPTSRPASRFAKRKLASGFFGRAPRARTWSRCSQVADLHQGNRLHRYETAPGCVVAPNNTPDEKKKDEKNDCYKFVDDILKIVDDATSDGAFDNPISRASIGIGFLGAAQWHGRDRAWWNLWLHTKPQKVTVTGFRPELVAARNDSDVKHHVLGVAGSFFWGWTLPGQWQYEADQEQFNDPSISAEKRAETLAELASDEAGFRVGFALDRYLESGDRNRARDEMRKALCE